MAKKSATALRLVDIGDLSDQGTLTYCSTSFNRLKSNCEDKHEMIKKCHEYYRSSKKYLSAVNNRDSRPQYVSARPWQQVETIKSLMLGNNPEIYAQYEKGAEDKAQTVLDFTNDQMWDKEGIDYESMMEDGESDRIIGGTSIEKLWWDRRYEDVDVSERIQALGITLPENVLGFDITKKQTKRIMTVNQADAGVVDPLGFYCDPTVPRIKDQAEICETFYMLLSEIKNNCDNGLYRDWDEVKDMITETSEKDDKQQQKRSAAGMGSWEPVDDDTHDPLILVHQYWFKPNWVITIVPDRVVLQKKEHDYPYPPYVVKRFIRVRGEFWGIGAIEPIISLFDEKNELRNLRMSAKRRAYGMVAIINRIYMRDPKKQIKPQDFWLLDTKDINRAIRFESPKSNDDMLREEGLVDREIEIEGASQYVAGQGAGEPTETASGIMMLQNAGANKFKKPRGNLEHGIEEFVELLCMMNHQHLIENKEYYRPAKGQYMTKKWANFNTFDTAGGWYKLKVKLGSTKPINEDEQIRRILMILQTLGQDPNMNQENLKKDLLKAASFHDVDRYWRDVPMVPLPIVQQMLAERGGNGGAPSPGGGLPAGPPEGAPPPGGVPGGGPGRPPAEGPIPAGPSLGDKEDLRARIQAAMSGAGG